MKKKKLIERLGRVCFFFFISSLTSFAIGEHTSSNSLTISKNLDFEIEIESALDVDLNPVDLDFGDLVRGTTQKKVAQGDLKFNSGFNSDVKISIDYDKTNDKIPSDTTYAMYQIKHEDVKGEKITENDTLDVYIKRVKDVVMKKGEMKIPIIGEIRGVSKEAKLGKYSDKITATVFVTPIDPTNKISPERRVGN